MNCYLQIFALLSLLVSATGQASAHVENTKPEACIGSRNHSSASVVVTSSISFLPARSSVPITSSNGQPPKGIREFSELEPIDAISQFEVAHFAPQGGNINPNCCYDSITHSLVSQHVRLQI